jgi:hypothetical protein
MPSTAELMTFESMGLLKIVQSSKLGTPDDDSKHHG